MFVTTDLKSFIKDLLEIINKEESRIISIDLIFPYHDEFSNILLNELLKKNPRIHSIILFNSPYDKSFNPVWEKMGYSMFLKRNILNEKHCGIINSEYFYSNIKLFSESQSHNTCLNRKISIDTNGNIKNCPSMAKSFGNIKETKLVDALNNKTFKKYWNIVCLRASTSLIGLVLVLLLL